MELLLDVHCPPGLTSNLPQAAHEFDLGYSLGFGFARVPLFSRFRLWLAANALFVTQLRGFRGPARDCSLLLRGLTELQHLQCSMHCVVDNSFCKALTCLTACSSLRSLDLQLTNFGLGKPRLNLPFLPTLQRLTLTRSAPDSDSLDDIIAAAPQLSSLSIGWPVIIQDLSSLTSLSALQEVDLRIVSPKAGAELLMPHLQNLWKLQLHLQRFKALDLAALSNLRDLCLQGDLRNVTGFADREMGQGLTSLSQLCSLNLRMLLGPMYDTLSCASDSPFTKQMTALALNELHNDRLPRYVVLEFGPLLACFTALKELTLVPHELCTSANFAVLGFVLNRLPALQCLFAQGWNLEALQLIRPWCIASLRQLHLAARLRIAIAIGHDHASASQRQQDAAAAGVRLIWH